MHIEIFVEQEATPYLELTAKLRIETFKEYPYLYAGNIENGRNYVQRYIDNPKAMIAVAKVNNEIVGVSTGLPLSSNTRLNLNIRKALQSKNINIENYYYYGEVMILPEFKEKGILNELYSAQNSLIKKWGFEHVCILTIYREENHPLKPVNYRGDKKMWESLGFFKNDLTIEDSWLTFQTDKSIKDVKNILELRIKNLSESVGSTKHLI